MVAAAEEWLGSEYALVCFWSTKPAMWKLIIINSQWIDWTGTEVLVNTGG